MQYNSKTIIYIQYMNKDTMQRVYNDINIQYNGKTLMHTIYQEGSDAYNMTYMLFCI